MKRAALTSIAGAILAASLVFAGLASAGLGSTTGIPVLDTTVLITGGSTPDNDTLIEGKVKSPKKACRFNRTIILTYSPEGGPDPVDIPVRRSKAGGIWKIRIPETSGGGHYGTYVATAKRRKLRSGAVCKAGQSDAFNFEH